MGYLDLAKQAAARLDAEMGVHVEPSFPPAFPDRAAGSLVNPNWVSRDVQTRGRVALDFAATLRDALRRACFELGEAAGWPELPYRAGHTVSPGAALWGKWLAQASVPDMQRALAALHEHLATIPLPEGPRASNESKSVT